MSTYKRPQFLKTQLTNLLLQEYSNFEIIISDNDVAGSSKTIVESFNDPRIKYYINDTNIGMVKSFNKSIERSIGDYIVMITDDDPAYIDMLSTLIPLTQKYPNYGVYAGCGNYIIENSFSEKTIQFDLGTNSTLLKTLKPNEIICVEANDFAAMYFDVFFSNTYLLWSCCIVKREIILKIKGMPDYGSELLTDHAFIIVTSSQQGMVYINKAMGGQAIHGDNYGYNFEKIKEKYIATPNLFYNYLKENLISSVQWIIIEPKIWSFVGRGFVEYSLMIYRTLKYNKQTPKLFHKAFKECFSNKNISKWKYKFYLKAYLRPIFNILLRVKKLVIK